jgi:hypothetical protein
MFYVLTDVCKLITEVNMFNDLMINAIYRTLVKVVQM